MVHVHYLGPAFHGDALENCQKSFANVVKVYQVIVQLLDFRVIAQAALFPIVRVLRLVIHFEPGSTVPYFTLS